MQEEGINSVLFDRVLSDWAFVLLLKGVSSVGMEPPR